MPFSAISELKTFRDLIAHGKPETQEFDSTIELAQEKVTELRSTITPKWEEYCNESKVADLYAGIDEVCKLLLEKSGLDLFDTLSGGGSMIERVG